MKKNDVFFGFESLKAALPKSVQESMSAAGIMAKVKKASIDKTPEQRKAIQDAAKLGAQIQGVESGFAEFEAEANKSGYEVAYSYDKNTNTIQMYLVPHEESMAARRKELSELAADYPVIKAPIEIDSAINFHGMEGISGLYAGQGPNKQATLVSLQRKNIEAATRSLRGKRAQEALKNKDKKEVERIVSASQRRIMSSVNVAGNYVAVTAEGKKARSGTGTPMQRANRASTLHYDDFLTGIIKSYWEDFRKQNKERVNFSRYNTQLMNGMEMIMYILSSFPPDQATKLIEKNPNLKIITNSSAWKTGSLRRELNSLAAMGFNAGLTGEESFSHYETSLMPKSVHAGGSFDQDSSRKRQQVAKYAELQKRAIEKRNKSKVNRQGRLFSKEELKAGVKYDSPEEKVYGIIEATQEQYALAIRHLLDEAKKSNDADAIKKYQSLLGAGIGLDSIVLSEEVKDEMASSLRHSKKVNKEELKKLEEKFKKEELKKKPNKRLSDEEITKKAIASILHIEGDFEIAGRKEEGDDYRYEYLTNLDPKTGTKYLLKSGYGRSAASAYIPPELIKEVLKIRARQRIEQAEENANKSDAEMLALIKQADDEIEKKFDKMGIAGIRSAGKIGAKNIGGILTEALYQVFSEIDFTKPTKKRQKTLNTVKNIIDKSPLKGYITFDEKRGIWVTDGSKLKEIAADKEGIKQVNDIIRAINRLGNVAEIGIGDIFNVEKGPGRSKNYSLTDNFIARTAIRQIDETPYGAPGGAVFNADYRALGATKRMISLVGSGQRMDTLRNYMDLALGPKADQKEHLAKIKKDSEDAIKNTLKTLQDDFAIGQNDVTVGHGSQYTINLDDYEDADEELFDHMENGVIDAEAFQKTSYYKIQEKMLEAAKNGGSVYYDPNLDAGYFREFDEKTGLTFGGKMAALSTFDVVPIIDKDGKIVGYKINENRLSAFRSMDRSAQKALETKDDWDQQYANSAAVDYFVTIKNDVDSKEGSTFQRDTKRGVLHSDMSKSAGANYGDIDIAKKRYEDAIVNNNYRDAVDEALQLKKMMTAVVKNPNDLRAMLSGQQDIFYEEQEITDADGKTIKSFVPVKIQETTEERGEALETAYQQLYGQNSAEFIKKQRDNAAKIKIEDLEKEKQKRIAEVQRDYATKAHTGYFDENGDFQDFGSAEAFRDYRIKQIEDSYIKYKEDYNKFYDKKYDISVADNTWAQRLLSEYIVDSVTEGREAYNERKRVAAEKLSRGEGDGSVEGLFGQLFRYPLSSGLDDKAVEMFADESVEEGSSRAGLGVWQEIKGDNDGDKMVTMLMLGDAKAINEALNLSKSGSPKEREKARKILIDQARQVIQKQQRISNAVGEAVNRDIKEEENKAKKAGFTTDDIKKLSNKDAERTSAILARYNKNKTGLFSNYYQGVTEAMSKLGVDESGIGTDVSSQTRSAKAMITRGLFEAVTQDAISSKKVADRIEKKYGKTALTDDNSQFYHELDDLVEQMNKKETFDNKDNLNALKKKMIDMGILDKDTGFDSKISARILATIKEYSHGEKVLEKILGKNVVSDKDFLKKVEKGEISLSADQIFSAVSATNTALASQGGIGGAIRSRYSNIAGMSDASWNPAVALGKKIDENNPAFKEYNETLKEVKQSVDDEAKSEQAKIGIAEKEAAAILKLAGVYGGLGETLDKVKLANEALNSANWNTDPIGITGLLQKQFGVIYEDRGFGRTVSSFGDTGEVGIEGRRYRIEGFKPGQKIPKVEDRKWIDESGQEIADQDLIARLNRMGYDEDDYKRLSKTFGAMEYGNIAHTTQEIVTTLGLGISDFENISNYSDFRKIIEDKISELENSQDDKEKELAKRARAIWEEKYDKKSGRGGGTDVYVERYSDALRLIGKTEEEIEKAVQKFVNIGIHYSDVATQGGNKRLWTSSEARVGVPVKGVAVNSAIDSLVYDPDRHVITYRDFKTKSGKVSGHEIAQLYSYIFGDQAALTKISGVDDGNFSLDLRRNPSMTYEDFINNHGSAFGYTAENPLSRDRFDTFQQIIKDAKKITKEEASRRGIAETDAKSINNLFKNILYEMFEGAIVRGSEEGGDSTYLSLEMLRRTVTGPLADVLTKLTKGDTISEEESKLLEDSTYKGQGVHDKWGERPGSSYYKEKEEAAEQEAQEKSLKSDYVKLLKEQYDLLIKIDAVKEKMRRAEERGERTTGFEEDLKILQKAKRSISRQMHSDKFADLTDDEDIQNAEDVQKHRRKSKKATLGLGGAEEQLAYFEKYAERRIGLEAKIEDATIKAQTAQTTNARKSFENLKTIYVKHLSDTDEIFEKLSAIVKEKFPEQFDEINKRMEEQRALLFAQKAASNRGNRTIFDVIKSDIQRATMRITDFGLAARVLNTARKEIQQVYQNILKLDEAMTNLRIVTGANTEQAKSMMNTYNDLAMQLGTTTQAVAQSAAEWLRQGYSVSEANELIKSSTYLSRLGFMDMGQSVTALTSVMKGFRIEATNSMDIVDKLTQLDAKYATTAGDIATALSRTSAVAREAGLSLDQTAAALTTMIDVSQQDASSVGNAFRTILARYGNVKATAFTSLVGDSEDIDDANGSINDTEKVLGAIGIKIRSSSSDMRDFDDVMDELADKWVTLTDVEKNAVATALAGELAPVCGLKYTQRTHLIAGKTLESFTTIIKKLDYDGLKTKGLVDLQRSS